ncbi:MAG: metallopeptidase TldD-related protein [Myxococcota bacterium]
MNRRQALRLAAVLREEAERAKAGLRIPGHPRPHFVSLQLRDLDAFRLKARFGGITKDSRSRRRSGLADIRVGSYRRDQVGHGGLRSNSDELESHALVTLPAGGTEDGLRYGLWRLLEAKYREACDDLLHRKAEELNHLDEHRNLPSFERRDAERVCTLARMPAIDEERFRKLAKGVSQSFRRYPRLMDGHVAVSAANEARVFVSTEGAEVITHQARRTVELHTWHFSEEGYGFPQTKTWFVTDEAELPDAAELRRVLRFFDQRFQALRSAPLLRSYVGPVLLDPRPAGLLVHEALGHRLEGNRLLSGGEGHTFRDSLGESLLHEGLSVRDDPRLERWGARSLVGHYSHDDEGVPADAAELIAGGTIQGFLTSRAPIAKGHRSNGHARSDFHQRATARMGVTVVEGEDPLDDDALMEAFLEEIRAQGVPWGVRIIEANGGETSTDAYDFQAFLGDVDVAARVHPDGRQELIRGVDLVGTPLNAVRGIVAIGARQEVDNAWCGAESGFVPVTTVSPALVAEELELQSKPDRPMTQYALPPPWERRKP